MSRIARFAEYAARFEEAFESDDWSLLEPFFTEEAVYDAGPDPTFGGVAKGREAVLAHFARVIEGFDRRFDRRDLTLLAGPEERGEAVWIRGRATYSSAGVPDLPLELEETVVFDGDRIARIEDVYTTEMTAAARAYLERHRAALGIEL